MTNITHRLGVTDDVEAAVIFLQFLHCYIVTEGVFGVAIYSECVIMVLYGR